MCPFGEAQRCRIHELSFTIIVPGLGCIEAQGDFLLECKRKVQANLDCADRRGLGLWIRNRKSKKPADEGSLALNMTLARAIWRSSKPCFMPRRVLRCGRPFTERFRRGHRLILDFGRSAHSDLPVRKRTKQPLLASLMNKE